jgi:HEPN domain-containing protein
VEKLRKRGESFLRNAKRNYEEKDFDTSMFNLEQATQLFLKAKILEFGIQFPKLHDIFELINILKKSWCRSWKNRRGI